MKNKIENRRALARPEFGAVTTRGEAKVTNLRSYNEGKHSKGKVSPYNSKKKRK